MSGFRKTEIRTTATERPHSPEGRQELREGCTFRDGGRRLIQTPTGTQTTVASAMSRITRTIVVYRARFAGHRSN